jgi:hypothetical protein
VPGGILIEAQGKLSGHRGNVLKYRRLGVFVVFPQRRGGEAVNLQRDVPDGDGFSVLATMYISLIISGRSAR